MIVRLVAVRVCDIPENLILREEEKEIGRRGDCARCRATPVIIRVLCNALERVTELGGYSPHNAARGRRLARTANIIPHVRVLPPAGVGVARIHAERRRGASIEVLPVGKANVRTAGEGRLCKLEVDTARTLPARVVIKPDDKSVGREIREGEAPHCAVEGDLLSVADGPIVRALSRVGDLGNGIPTIFVERVAHEREGNRIGGRRGYDVDRPARALPALRGLDRVLSGLVDGKYRRPGAGLCVHRGAAFFERYGRAGGRGNGNRRREEREGYRVAVDHTYRLRIRGLSVEGRGNCPRPGLRERQHARAIYRRPAHAPRSFRRGHEGAGRNGHDKGELRPRLADRVCSSNRHFYTAFMQIIEGIVIAAVGLTAA